MITESAEKYIVLKLNESGDAQSFKVENLVHRAEFNRVFSIIDKRIILLERKTDLNEPTKRLHDTLTILGSRGSGKTSFIQSIQLECQSNKYKKDVEVLNLIDPTLIEEKGHIFLTIISAIQERVDEVIDRNECDPTFNNNLHKRKEWKNLIGKLAAGIPSLDGVGGHLTNNEWQDPEYIMDKGLRGVNAARNLENDFHKVVKKALEVLGNKKIFLIAFDDIDVDSKKGWPVLETIRKYFTSPHIVVILSGDSRLFSLGIRKRQWENIGEHLLKNDKTIDSLEIVNEMEGQYLKKVMKPENRTILKTINEKLSFPNYNLHINENVKDGVSDIVTVYNKILTLFGINDSFQAEAYRTFLLSLPLRSQIQFLSAFAPAYVNGVLELKKENGDNYLSEVMVNTFLSELYQQQINFELGISTPKFLNTLALQFLLKEKILTESYQLQPTTTNHSINCGLITLNFLISDAIKDNPSLIFDYFIRIGLTRNLLSEIGYLEESDKDEYKSRTVSASVASIEGLCKHAELFQDRVLRDSVGLINAYTDAHGQASKKWGGIIRIKGFAHNNKDLSRRLDSILERDQNKKIKSLGYFPMTSLSDPTKKQATEVVYSIYTLIGTLGELIRKDRKKTLERSILELSQKRTYPKPNFKRAIETRLDEQESNLESFDKAIENINLDLEECVDKWLSKFFTKAISVHLLGKISTRMFYAFENINDTENDRLGSAMHKRVITFFNSVLVEDIKENASQFLRLNLDNAVNHDRVFINNLLKAIQYTNKDELSFSMWILSCPLFLSYIDINRKRSNRNNSVELIRLIRGFCGKYFIDNSIDFCIYDELQKVFLAGQTETDINIENNNNIEKKSQNGIKKIEDEELNDEMMDTIVNYFKTLPNYYEYFTKKKNLVVSSIMINDELKNTFGLQLYTSGIQMLKKYVLINDTKW